MKKAGRKPLMPESAVRLIRAAYDAAKAAGRRPRLAPHGRRYGVSRGSVLQAARRETYKWVRE